MVVKRAGRSYDAPGHKPRWRALWSEMVAIAANGHDERAVAVAKGYAPDQCQVCSAFKMVRTGACLRCDECGSTTGCG